MFEISEEQAEKMKKGGYLNKMAQSKNSNSLSKKHTAEADALDAKHAAEKAALEHKQEKERVSNGPKPITAPRSVNMKVKRPDLSKFPKGTK